MSDEVLIAQIASALVLARRASPSVAEAAARALVRELAAECGRGEAPEVSRAWVEGERS